WSSDVCSSDLIIGAQNANLSRGAAGIFSRAFRRLMGLYHCSTDYTALRVAQLFLQFLHLLADIACFIKIPMHVVVSSGHQRVTLRHFFLGKLNSDLLLLTLAQHRERYLSAYGESLQELSQLRWFHQNLVVQHLKDIVLL